MVHPLKTSLFVILIAGISTCLAQSEIELQQEAANALASATSVTLYSLEPNLHIEPGSKQERMEKLQGYLILGKVGLVNSAAKRATKAFQDAVRGWGASVGACFAPHHALSLVSGGHTYDFLLCYQCHGMALVKDGKYLASFGAYGSPKALNRLLTANRVPLSSEYDPEAIANRERWEQAEKAYQARQKATMPTSLKTLLKADTEGGGLDMDSFHKALSKQFPDKRKQISALLKWYGAGVAVLPRLSGSKSLAGELLLFYPTADILDVLQRKKASYEHVEGAARLFSAEIRKSRPDDLNLLSPELKALFAEHESKWPPPQ
jgi:hypothetical protein